MKLYWFERSYPIPNGLKQRSLELQSNGFDGTMYPYGVESNDYFTKIAKDIDMNSQFEYIVAIRPYTISAQYLSMICSSLNEISKNRISINFLTGWIYDNEYIFGGILEKINDFSSNVERSNYMMEYAKVFSKISKTNFYLSTTNNIVFDFCNENNLPMIIPYSWYKLNKFELSNHKYLLSVCPIISENEKEIPTNQDADIFTESEFIDFLNESKEKGIYGILLFENMPNTEYDKIVNIVKRYKGE